MTIESGISQNAFEEGKATYKSTRYHSDIEKIEYWNDCISEQFTHMEAVPDEETPFEAALTCKKAYGFSLANPISTAASVFHTNTHIRASTERVFLLHLQRKGTSVNIQGNNVAFLKSGDFTICDSASPYEVRFKHEIDMLVARVPEKQLLSRVPDLHLQTATCVSGESGVGALASKMIQAIWEGDASKNDMMIDHKVAGNMLDLIATAYSSRNKVERESISETRRYQVMEFVDRNIHNANLSPKVIAEASNISLRYLHKLFSEHGTTVNGWIIEKRLDLAAKLLRDTREDAVSITEIAYKIGFKDVSHFSSRFRKSYGVSPRSYRFE